MKKRFVCFLLTLMLLVSLVPATALTASAASYGVSNSAITVLKKMVSYNRTATGLPTAVSSVLVMVRFVPTSTSGLGLM